MKINKDNFIEQSRLIHGNKFDYSKSEFVNMNTKMCIICPEHGEFWQTPKAHIINGYGCRKCGRKPKDDKIEERLNSFIERATTIHKGKYDYSQVTYVNANTPVDIICPKHGIFQQPPHDHLKGCGCRKCSQEALILKHKLTNEEFVERANEIHHNYYDYNKCDINNRDENGKVIIICPKHGEFKITPHNHLQGQGCKLCGYEKISQIKSISYNDFIIRSNLCHNGCYNYSLVNIKDKYINIICPKHGIFQQNKILHLNGHGCPKCAQEKNGLSKRSNTISFIKKASIIHNGKYSYENTNYIKKDVKVLISCPIHGEFSQTPDDHLMGKGCPRCGYQLSNAENEIYEYCCSLVGKENVIQRCRDIISPYEIDIYIPSLKIGIEYNGLKWHSEEYGKDKHYHLNKTDECKKKGIRLIQIFEDEYNHSKDIVFNKIKHLLKCSDTLPKIMGRKCNIKIISSSESRVFLTKFHIQGFANSTIHLGAYYKDELIAVMSFRSTQGKWELTRFASNYDYICQGVGGKLFKYFIRNYNPEEIKSFADRRWTINEDSNIYIQLGFKFDKYTPPEYRYYYTNGGKERIHKFNFRKQRIAKKYKINKDLSESNISKQLGFSKIWDCGLIRYIWINKNNTKK